MRRVDGFVLLMVWILLVGCVTEQTQIAPIQQSTPAPSLSAPTPTVPIPTVIPSGLYVDATASTTPINPLVYGTNYGPWLVVTVDVQDEFAESGLTYLRFPGGRYGDTYDLREYQIDQFIDLAAVIDAEVTISVRLLGGSPEDAAEIVRYTNIEKGYDVTYWSIGNEPSLYTTMQAAPEWDTAFYNQQWRLFAEAMLAVDPEIQLLGPNIHQISADSSTRPKDDNGLDWLEEFLVANGDLVDVVTFHRYPFPISRADPIPTFEMLRDNPPEWDTIIPSVRQTIRDITGEDKPIGVMEINSNYTDVSTFEYSPDGFYNAIWWGDVLGRFINQRVDMVTHFALQHKSSGWGMLGRTEPRPTYFVYRMYQHLGDQLLFSESDDPFVSIVAAQRDDGATTVMVINRGDRPITQSFTMVGVDTAKAQEVWRLEPDVFAENLGAQPIGDTINLPAQSMTLFVFR